MVKWSSLVVEIFFSTFQLVNSSCHCQNPGFVHTAAYVATARILAPKFFYFKMFFHSSHFRRKIVGGMYHFVGFCLPHFFRQIITA